MRQFFAKPKSFSDEALAFFLYLAHDSIVNLVVDGNLAQRLVRQANCNKDQKTSY
jgi:hypothetical protein